MHCEASTQRGKSIKRKRRVMMCRCAASPATMTITSLTLTEEKRVSLLLQQRQRVGGKLLSWGVWVGWEGIYFCREREALRRLGNWCLRGGMITFSWDIWSQKGYIKGYRKQGPALVWNTRLNKGLTLSLCLSKAGRDSRFLQKSPSSPPHISIKGQHTVTAVGSCPIPKDL